MFLVLFISAFTYNYKIEIVRAWQKLSFEPIKIGISVLYRSKIFKKAKKF